MMQSLYFQPFPFPCTRNNFNLAGFGLRAKTSSFGGYSLKENRKKAGIAVRMNINDKDYYRTLNVHKTATKHEIRSAYKILARQYHPDMNKSPGAEEKFKEIGAAYEVLSDDEKRSLYDQYGQGGVEGRFEDSTGDQPEVSPFDLFDSIFSGGSGAFNVFGEIGGTTYRSQFHEARKGDDVRLKLSLSLKEAVFGIVKDIEIFCLDTCRICKGSGAKFGSSETCQDCGGKCHVRKTQRTPFGIISQVSTCSRCRGEGKVITDPCHRCGGHGRVRSKKTINVKIPPGVSSGNTIRVNGGGHSGRKGGPSGDLYVFLDVQDMQGIARDDVHLYSNITISYTDAILGTVSKVETVEGFKNLEIPAGTQPGDVLVIRNMGVPNLGKPSKRGDHFFVVNVAIPKRLSVEEHKLVERLAHLHGLNSYFSNIYQGGDDSARKEQKKNTSTECKVPAQGDSKSQSFWNSIRNMARSMGSKNNFSCVSLQAMVSHDVPFVGSSNSTLTYHCFSPLSYFCLLFVCFGCVVSDIQTKLKRGNSSMSSDNQEKK